MKIAPRDIDAFVKRPSASALAVLVYGPDEGLVRERAGGLARAVVADPQDPFGIAEMSGDALDGAARLVDEAKSISMLGGRRVIRLRGGNEKTVAAACKDLLSALKEGDNLVVVEAGELGPRSPLRLLFEGADNGASLPCYADDAQAAGRIAADALRAGGYRISPDALALLSAAIAGDRALARGEVDKLITYMGPMKDIGPEDVAACVSGAADVPLEDLARHVGAGRLKDADRVLGFALSEGLNAVAILRALQNHFTRLHVVKARLAQGGTFDAAIAKLRPPVFFKHKADFQAQAGSLSLPQIEQALNVIASAEARCKQTASQPDVIAGRAVLALCQLCARAAARGRR